MDANTEEQENIHINHMHLSYTMLILLVIIKLIYAIKRYSFMSLLFKLRYS